MCWNDGVVNRRDCRTHLFLFYQRGADDIKPNIKDYGGAFTFHASFLLIFSTEISPPSSFPPARLKTFSAVDRIYISASRTEKYYKLKKIISWCMGSYFLPVSSQARSDRIIIRSEEKYPNICCYIHHCFRLLEYLYAQVADLLYKRSCKWVIFFEEMKSCPLPPPWMDFILSWIIT